jgi:hypothetical protein
MSSISFSKFVIISSVNLPQKNISIGLAPMQDSRIKELISISEVSPKKKAIVREKEKATYAGLDVQITQSEMILPSGSYEIKEDLIVPKHLKLVINAGTTLLLGEEKVVVGFQGIEVRGTKEKLVVIRSKESGEPFGAIGILGNKNTHSKINYIDLSNGSERWVNGVFFQKYYH